MDELKDLYSNAFSYAENFGYNTSKEYKALAQYIDNLIEGLSIGLEDEQIAKLKRLRELYTRQVCLETDRMFFYAYKSGARLIMDIKSE